MSTPDPSAVDRAVQALRAFGDLDYGDAGLILPLWRHYDELSREDRRAVLAQFPPVPRPVGPIQEAASGPGW